MFCCNLTNLIKWVTLLEVLAPSPLRCAAILADTRAWEYVNQIKQIQADSPPLSMQPQSDCYTRHIVHSPHWVTCTVWAFTVADTLVQSEAATSAWGGKPKEEAAGWVATVQAWVAFPELLLYQHKPPWFQRISGICWQRPVTAHPHTRAEMFQILANIFMAPTHSPNKMENSCVMCFSVKLEVGVTIWFGFLWYFHSANTGSAA